MERREFLSVAGVALVSRRMGGWSDGRMVRSADPAIRPSAHQSPTLGPTTYAQPIAPAQAELKSRNLDLLVVEPSTNFQYFTSYNPGRSERLILLMIPANSAPVIVCPSFEVERIKRNTTVTDG